MTYNVFGGTLNLAQSHPALQYVFFIYTSSAILQNVQLKDRHTLMNAAILRHCSVDYTAGVSLVLGGDIGHASPQANKMPICLMYVNCT